MKTLLKKLSSAVLAIAVAASLTSAPGIVILADETEPEAPAVTSETEPEKKVSGKKEEEKDNSDSDKPKETEKAEEKIKETEPAAPKETEKPEADVPEETEKAETEEPEETGKTESEQPKETEKVEEPVPEETGKEKADTPKETDKPDENVPVQPELPQKEASDTAKNASSNGIKNVSVKNGVLSWTCKGASYYNIYFDEYIVYSQSRSINLNKWIDKLIREKKIDKAKVYDISILAYGEDEDEEDIGYYNLSYTYNSAAKPNSIGKVNASLSGSTLKWSGYKNAEYYCVIISNVELYVDTDSGLSVNLNTEIDKLLKTGEIRKSKSYNVILAAYDDDSVLLAKWTTSYNYESKVTTPSISKISGVKYSNGFMSWNKVKGANNYYVSFLDNNGSVFCTFANDENKTGVNDYFQELLWNGRIFRESDLKNLKTVKITATKVNYDTDNETYLADYTGSFRFAKASNTLSISGKTVTVKAKKLKKKSLTLSDSKVIDYLDSGNGELDYYKLSGNKKIKINKDTGAVTLKKKLKKKKKGYKVKIKVKARGDWFFKPCEKTVTIKIKVK